jgi:hypothetical protein
MHLAERMRRLPDVSEVADDRRYSARPWMSFRGRHGAHGDGR